MADIVVNFSTPAHNRYTNSINTFMVYLLILLEAGEGVVEDCHEVHRVTAQTLEVLGDTLWSNRRKQSLLGFG